MQRHPIPPGRDDIFHSSIEERGRHPAATVSANSTRVYSAPVAFFIHFLRQTQQMTDIRQTVLRSGRIGPRGTAGGRRGSGSLPAAWLSLAMTIGGLLGHPTSLPAAALEAVGSRPHIVFLLADDLGWADVGFHGSNIRTVHLDRLASEGVRLESFYVQPVCSPTRAALMTGRYPIRHGLQVGVIRPWAQHGLPLRERTLAQALADVGYHTALCGKWHLGFHQAAYLPTRRGFQQQYGHFCGAIDYFTHRRDGGLDWHRDDQVCNDTGYTTVLIGDEAVRIIEQHDPAQPLLLYVPFNAPHTPLQALPEHLAQYCADQGPKTSVLCRDGPLPGRTGWPNCRCRGKAGPEQQHVVHFL